MPAHHSRSRKRKLKKEACDLFFRFEDGSFDEETSNCKTNSSRPFCNRKIYQREDYEDSCWGRFLRRNFTEAKNSKLFRLRFAIPYQMYTEILESAKLWFPQPSHDICGRPTSPIKLKLLGALRILAKGCSWDLLYELTGISPRVHTLWTTSFLKKFNAERFHMFVHEPRNQEEIKKVLKIYTASGFPGCIGSIDCVHIRWDMCPAKWQSLYRNGKYPFPTISYQMSVDHTKRFQSCTSGFYGTSSDKTIVRFDGYVEKIRFNELFSTATFKLQVSPDCWIIETGLYLLCDGGYHKWRILQCPYKYTSDEDRTRWSEFAESIRKDIECAFGILKKRFQFLKSAIVWHSKEDIDQAVYACVVLHNMLHEFDKIGERWEAAADKANRNASADNDNDTGDDDDDNDVGIDSDNDENNHLATIAGRVHRALDSDNSDNSNIGILPTHYLSNTNSHGQVDGAEIVEISTDHEALKNKLILHLNVMHRKGKLRWIRI